MPINIAKLTKQDVARMMDYAILAPEWQDKQQLAGCEDVRKYKFAAYYILPHWTPLVVKEIGDFARENHVLIGTGISFPYGSGTTSTKLFEAEDQIKIGCTVLDMVGNISWLKDRKYDLYAQECNQFVKLCHDAGLIAKVIISVGYLTGEEIAAATKIVAESGAEFVKTATGTGPSGRPNFNDAKIMLDTLAEMKSSCKLKVSGVVEPRIINAYNFIRMGAMLIGTRSAVEIVEALPEVQKTLFPD
ncbi:MAG: deoxyribose-phosphate aldolase [Anaerolineae bacterium]|nr:deoxyribose-phosphate aldolase [Anaerolineae bacterium]